MEMEKKESNSTTTSTFRLVKTGFLVLTCVSMGLFLEISGPTLHDLKWQLNTTYHRIASAIAGRDVGFFIGAAGGGFVIDKLVHFRYLVAGIFLCVAAVATALVPWCYSEELLFFLFCMKGICEGVLNIDVQRLVIDMWAERSAPPMHLVHLGYGVGAIMSLLIANPFLSVRQLAVSNSSVTEFLQNQSSFFKLNNLSQRDSQSEFARQQYFVVQNITTDANHSANDTDSQTAQVQSRIVYPYTIASSMAVVVAVAFFVFQLLYRHTTKDNGTKEKNRKEHKFNAKTLIDMINPGSCTGGDVCYGIQIFLMLFIFFFNAVGGERVAGKLIRVFAMDHLMFSDEDATHLNTSFWISFLIGRICGCLATHVVPIRVMLILEVLGIFICTIVLNIFGYYSSLGAWICTPALGFFMSLLFPSGVAWANFHVEVTGVALAVLMLGGATGGIAYLNIAGYLYDSVGPMSFLYVLLGYGCAVCVVTGLLTLVASRHISNFDQHLGLSLKNDIDCKMDIQDNTEMEEDCTTDTATSDSQETSGFLTSDCDSEDISGRLTNIKKMPLRTKTEKQMCDI